MRSFGFSILDFGLWGSVRNMDMDSPKSEIPNLQSEIPLRFAEDQPDLIPAVEDYLECLLVPLVGIVPFAQRQEFIAEAREHLEEAIEIQILRGTERDIAIYKSLELYGKPLDVANNFLESWFQTRNKSYLAKRFGYANLIAFFCVQLVVVTYVVLLQLRIYLPDASGLRLAWSPAQVRSVWPEPLPFPDFTPSFFIMIGFPIIAPFIAGYLTGRFIPVGAAKAYYHAMMMLIVWSFMMGAMMLPMTEGLLFALFEVFFWLPVGSLTAHISSTMARSSRCRPQTQ